MIPAHMSGSVGLVKECQNSSTLRFRHLQQIRLNSMLENILRIPGIVLVNSQGALVRVRNSKYVNITRVYTLLFISSAPITNN